MSYLINGLGDYVWGIMKDMADGKIQARYIGCKCCHGTVWKYGRNRNNVQRYYCPKCDRVFLDNDNLLKMSISIKQLGDVIGQYYGGMSLKELKRQFEQQHNQALSRSSFDRWLAKFSKIAITEVEKYHPKVGDKWIADETVLKIGGKNVWCWDIIDADTRFLLATHLSKTRTIEDAQILMEKAEIVANKIPKIVITDHLRAYIDGIELTWGSETKHIQSKPFAEADISTNKIERFHSTLKTRTEIMRGLKSLETAQSLLDGWLVHYNFFRPHESLDDKSPAEEAKIKFPFKNWLDVIESQRIILTQESEPTSYKEKREFYKHPTFKHRIKQKVKRIKQNKPNSIRGVR
jgi:transposase-like protein